jgi:hypothetical protein
VVVSTVQMVRLQSILKMLQRVNKLFAATVLDEESWEAVT